VWPSTSIPVKHISRTLCPIIGGSNDVIKFIDNTLIIVLNLQSRECVINNSIKLYFTVKDATNVENRFKENTS